MNKEPIGLYIFRFLVGLGLLAFMCMLYWSSNLLELDVKNVQLSNIEIKNELNALRSDVERLRGDLLQAILNQNQSQPENSSGENDQNTNSSKQNQSTFEDKKKGEKAKHSSSNKLIAQNNSQNLLKIDPFYTTTLPKLLGKDFRPRGSRLTAVVGKPDNLHPFSNWSNVSSWISMCSVTLSQQAFGIYETFAPDMAIKIEEKLNEQGIPVFWIHLRDGVFWQPLNPRQFPEDFQLAPHFLKRHQVTAHDFKFYFDAIMNPHVQVAGAVALRNYIGDIEEIKVIDNLTMTVRWKSHEVTQPDRKVIHQIKYVAKLLTGSLKPLASFVYQYFPDGKKIIEEETDDDTYRNNAVWAQNFAQHWAKDVIVSCGPWIFEGMTDNQITFRRNPQFYSPLAALSEKIHVYFKESPDAMWQDFKEGDIDTYVISPTQLIELNNFLKSSDYQKQVQTGLSKGSGSKSESDSSSMSIQKLDYLARIYTYIGWNQAKPWFKNKKVRQALTMAIDRQRIIKQNLNGMGIEVTGTFYRYSPAYDTSIVPWPFDPQAARRILEEEGWYDSDGDGVIDKVIDGTVVPFRFSLTYFVKNPTTRAICEYIATALKEIGIECNLNGVDMADLSASFDEKSFDALALAWALGTPPDEPRQLWYSTGAKEKGSSNAVGFANAEADKIIDDLDYEYDPKKRIELYHRFCQILHDEVPYTFLYSPKNELLYRNFVKNVFIPSDRQDLIPGANVAEPESSIFWIDR